MYIFDTSSWHYKFVLYVLGKNFFTEKDTINLDESEKKNIIIWTRKPRVVNFCPYCRAVLYSLITVPFVWIWKKLPHKPKKEKTHAEIMKSMRIKNILIRSFAGSINIVLGLSKIPQGEYALAAVQIAIGIVLIFLFQFAHVMAPGFRKFVKFIEKYWPKKKQYRPKKQKPIKNPNFLKIYLTENHDKFCPPIAFVDKNDTEIKR